MVWRDGRYLGACPGCGQAGGVDHYHGSWRARGARSREVARVCANWQAVVRSRTSCKVPDVPQLFSRPTTPQPAAFILPLCGRVLSCTNPHRRICDNARNSTKKRKETHRGLRSDDLDANRLSIGAVLVSGTAAAGLDKRRSSAARSPFRSPPDVPSAFVDLVGNNALDQRGVRS